MIDSKALDGRQSLSRNRSGDISAIYYGLARLDSTLTPPG